LNQICNIYQCNTDDGGQAMGEELRYVQMSRWWKKWATIGVISQRAMHWNTSFNYKGKQQG